MASVKKNAIYVSATGTVTVEALKPRLLGVMVTPNAANSRLVIKESVSGTIVVDITIETVETRLLTFEAFNGIELNSSFEVSTFTFLDTVILYGSWDKPVNRAVG